MDFDDEPTVVDRAPDLLCSDFPPLPPLMPEHDDFMDDEITANLNEQEEDTMRANIQLGPAPRALVKVCSVCNREKPGDVCHRCVLYRELTRHADTRIAADVELALGLHSDDPARRAAAQCLFADLYGDAE